MLRLAKFEGNPIIAPRPREDWEIGGTFNPGAVANGQVIDLLYRAVDENKVSRLAYARILDGTRITFRSPRPVLEPSADWEEFGCEDPRITHLDGTFYITYTAFSRRGTRIALASTRDFSNFRKFGLVGPGLNDKDCVIFPDRVDGRIALLHRLASKVQIAYFDSFESLVDSRKFWDEYVNHFDDYEVMRSKFEWEVRKVGIGPPPIKTARGWLVIYHGVSIDHVYRAGAALLDLDDPSRVLARTKEPVLEPESEFEKHGVVPNVVFPDGAIVRDGKLIIYYGGADKVCCAASAPFDEFLDELEKIP